MKKRIIISILVMIMFIFNCNISYAQPYDIKTFNSSNTSTATLINNATGEKITLEVTEQLIMQRNAAPNGRTSYTQVVETNVPLSSLLRDAGSSSTVEEPDTSGSCRALLKITYSKYPDNGQDMYLLEEVYGTWTIQDNQVSSLNRQYTYGCNSPSRPAVNDQTGYGNVSGMSFSKSTGFTKYINSTVPGSICGAYTQTTLKRAGSDHTWTLLIENNIVDTGGII